MLEPATMVAKKQASDTSSLAAELLHKINPMPYKTYMAKINECGAVTPDNYKTSRWANYFTVDSSNVVKNGCANPNHVFDTFGTFSRHTGTEVHIKLLANITENLAFYEKRSAVCLRMRSMNFEEWVHAIGNETVYCDELGLMGLCFMYHRHSVVLTQNKLWSTVQANHPLNLLDLLNICSVHLIYLGNLCFGVLTWRPHLPKKVAVKSPGFNIIEEYTIDETTSTHGSTARHVETDPVVQKQDGTGTVSYNAGPPETNYERGSLPEVTKADTVSDVSKSYGMPTSETVTESEHSNHAAQVQMTSDKRTSPEDGLVLLHYPWKLRPKIIIE